MSLNRTLIDWVKNPDGTQGFTSNPVRGECPVGCSYCYVKSFRTRYGWHKDIRFYPRELVAICKRNKPSGIFLGSTIELFHDKTIQYMADIMAAIESCPHHHFYLLTKQPQNLPFWSPFPDNCFVGVTATDEAMFNEALWQLSKIEASVKYISIEPFLKHIPMYVGGISNCGINQIIIGAQTKPYKPPKIEWVEEIVRACDKAGIQVFLKDNLRPILKDLPEYCIRWTGWGESTHRELRQELPIER